MGPHYAADQGSASLGGAECRLTAREVRCSSRGTDLSRAAFTVPTCLPSWRPSVAHATDLGDDCPAASLASAMLTSRRLDRQRAAVDDQGQDPHTAGMRGNLVRSAVVGGTVFVTSIVLVGVSHLGSDETQIFTAMPEMSAVLSQ
jgi:hypothetical protein